eukprot:7385052-Prymnesium_polylepis.4
MRRRAAGWGCVCGEGTSRRRERVSIGLYGLAVRAWARTWSASRRRSWRGPRKAHKMRYEWYGMANSRNGGGTTGAFSQEMTIEVVDSMKLPAMFSKTVSNVLAIMAISILSPSRTMITRKRTIKSGPAIGFVDSYRHPSWLSEPSIISKSACHACSKPDSKAAHSSDPTVPR